MHLRCKRLIAPLKFFPGSETFRNFRSESFYVNKNAALHRTHRSIAATSPINSSVLLFQLVGRFAWRSTCGLNFVLPPLCVCEIFLRLPRDPPGIFYPNVSIFVIVQPGASSVSASETYLCFSWQLEMNERRINERRVSFWEQKRKGEKNSGRTDGRPRRFLPFFFFFSSAHVTVAHNHVARPIIFVLRRSRALHGSARSSTLNCRLIDDSSQTDVGPAWNRGCEQLYDKQQANMLIASSCK